MMAEWGGVPFWQTVALAVIARRSRGNLSSRGTTTQLAPTEKCYRPKPRLLVSGGSVFRLAGMVSAVLLEEGLPRLRLAMTADRTAS
jgi:hypothetical protein